MAESPTSIGRPLRVSFGLAKPPASSFLYYEWIGDAPIEGKHPWDAKVIAAHGDSVLFEVIHKVRRNSREYMYNYFVYRAGGSRPPSLSQLSAGRFPTRFQRDQGVCTEPTELSLRNFDTGLLRHGDNDLQVVHLEMAPGRGPDQSADVSMLNLSRGEWEFKPAVPIVAGHNGCNEDQTMSWHGGNMVVPVGDRFMCWVSYKHGLIVHDTVQECPKLRYVPMPLKPRQGYGSYYEGYVPDMEYTRSVCSVGPCTVRYVSIDSRCCCGGPGRGTCVHSRYAFMITTWNLSLSVDDPMTWVKDTVLDCNDIWTHPAYEGLPRVHPQRPTMSIDNPDIVYFFIRDDDCTSFEKCKVWMVEVDMRVKSVMSVHPCTTKFTMKLIRIILEPRELGQQSRRPVNGESSGHD
ncbi:hypothetical protein EJB05_29075, partial [Eragrostis curvula]